jgi:hypothetical protein
VHLYVDDAREATLIKTSAALDYGKCITQEAERNSRHFWDFIGRLISIAIVVVSIWMPISCAVKSCKQEAPKRESVNAAPSQDPGVLRSSEEFDRITDLASFYVRNHLRDINKDGLINCIDRALIYKDYVPDARLFWGINPAKDFNHLFIGVLDTDGTGYVYIEPLSNPDNRKYLTDKFMCFYWWDRFDANQVKDVTAYEKQMRNGTFKWTWSLY